MHLYAGFRCFVRINYYYLFFLCVEMYFSLDLFYNYFSLEKSQRFFVFSNNLYKSQCIEMDSKEKSAVLKLYSEVI